MTIIDFLISKKTYLAIDKIKPFFPDSYFPTFVVMSKHARVGVVFLFPDVVNYI